MIALMSPFQLQKKGAARAARCAINRNTPVPQFVLDFRRGRTAPMLVVDFMNFLNASRFFPLVLGLNGGARIRRASADRQVQPTQIRPLASTFITRKVRA